jgi:hypothetical protein
VADSTYRTSDLYYAAYLKVAGVPLTGTEQDSSKPESKRVYFVFEGQDPGVLRDLKDQYFMDRAKVHALSYAQAVKVLKSLLHER